MPTTDNHPATRMALVVGAIAAATLLAALAVGKWAVFVPIVAIPAWRLSQRRAIAGALAAEGWSGHRFKDYWVYEEQQGRDRPSLSLKLERAGDDDDHYLLVLPSRDEWSRTMPLWAADRYDEITARVAGQFPPEDVRRAG